MHSLAIALKKAGHEVTGSDDQIYDPSRSALAEEALLPEKIGWDPSRIRGSLDLVIVGMHAKKDNPELLRAQSLGLPVVSYPEFIAAHCKDKHRIVVAGSHGKTTTTAMIMHALRAEGIRFDYLVGAHVPGFEGTVSLSEESLAMVIEGDEYPSSPVDPTPKFCQYNHHTMVLTGIAWDHINHFPSLEAYKASFHELLLKTPKAGVVVYNAHDKAVVSLVNSVHTRESRGIMSRKHIPYKAKREYIKKGISHVKVKGSTLALRIFGRHNMENMEAARLLTGTMAVEEAAFYRAIASFPGVAQRLSEVGTTHSGGSVYLDHAHAPSKVEASTTAIKKQFPHRPLVAIFEMHTFSSLNPTFTAQYKDRLKHADFAIIYINQAVLQSRSGQWFSEEGLRKAFNKKELVYLTEPQAIVSHIRERKEEAANYLFMSSGNFGGLDIKEMFTVPS